MTAYDEIRNAIIDGRFELGQRLTEEFLAGTFNLSRTPIREALRHLRSEGLVVADGRGVAVRSFTESEIVEIYDLRSLLEGYAASFAAMHATAADIVELEAVNDEMERILHEPYREFDKDQTERIMRSNQKLHESVMRLSGKAMLLTVVSRMMVMPLVFRSYFWRSSADIRQSYSDHQQVVRAIANHDVQCAQAAMAEHIFTGRDQVLRHLSRSPRTPLDIQSYD